MADDSTSTFPPPPASDPAGPVDTGTEPVKDNEVVVAGAGTGKTHTLVNAYLFTLLGLDRSGEPKAPHRVLAITFTDKAAAEMRRRVALRLGALARNPNSDPFVVERARELGLPLPAPSLAADLESRLPGAPISTFHALCGGLLRDLALQAGIDPGFAILDGNDERELLKESAEAVVLDALSEGQPEIASLIARFQLRRVGFGQGIVDGLVRVHTMLAERGLHPTDIKPVTTLADAEVHLLSRRKALRDSMTALRDESRGRSAFVHNKVREAVFHYKRFVAVLDETGEAAEFLIAQRFTDVRAPLSRTFGDRAVQQLRQSALRHLDEVGAALCDRVTATEAARIRDTLVQMNERVVQEKNARGVLGFGDLLLRMRDLLRAQPIVRARVKTRFDRILVDEYQDTSPVQEDLVALLAEDTARVEMPAVTSNLMGQLPLGPGRLFIVGDPKQSIYGFRGADSQLFSHTLKVVTEGSDRVDGTGVRKSLSKSFRSRPAILKLVNLVADATLSDGAYGVEVLPEDHLSPNREGDQIAGALLRPDDQQRLGADHAEAVVVARKIRTLIDDKCTVGDDNRTLRAKDIAVLVRRMRAAQPIAEALAHEGIPAHITGGEGFFARPEVMDLICALRLVVEPQDELATLAILRSPLAALTDDGIVALLDGIEGWRSGLSWQSVEEALPQAPLSDDEKERLSSFGALLRSIREQVHELPASRMVDLFIDQGAYDLAAGVEEDAADRLANLIKLRALAEGTPGEAIATIDRLWEYLDDPPQEGLAAVADPDADAVRIMTIHQSKGLEFPVVFVADAGSPLPSMPCVLDFEPGLGLAVSHKSRGISACAHLRSVALPENRPALERVRTQKKEREMSELGRLLYVALTRARDFVYFVGEERKQGAPSLRRYLERGRARHRDGFDAVFPTETILAIPGPARPLPVSRLPELMPVTAMPPLGPLRLLPSGLLKAASSDDEVIEKMRVRSAEVDENDRLKRNNREAREQGQLAHALFAMVAEEADAEMLESEKALRASMLLALRASGRRYDDSLEPLFRRIEKTLRGPLLELYREGYRFSFEEPICFSPTPEATLQGSADLVARSRADVLVIDLKSSAQAAASAGTHLQLLAYAAALEAREQKPVYFAAWVFGANEVASPVLLDEAGKMRLQASLNERVREHLGG